MNYAEDLTIRSEGDYPQPVDQLLSAAVVKANQAGIPVVTLTALSQVAKSLQSLSQTTRVRSPLPG